MRKAWQIEFSRTHLQTYFPQRRPDKASSGALSHLGWPGTASRSHCQNFQTISLAIFKNTLVTLSLHARRGQLYRLESPTFELPYKRLRDS